MSEITTKRKEVTYMNFVKAFAIIAVVLGHADGKFGPVYLYHMALFFFVAGYFYKDKYSNNPIKFIIARVKSIYFPFVGFGLLFLVLHNFLFKINIYSDKAGYDNNVSHLYNISEFIQNAKGVIKFEFAEQLGGTFWFFIVLFFTSILFCLISYFIENYILRDKEYVRFFIITTCFVIGNLATFNKISLPRLIDNRALVALSVYYLGYMYKKYESKISMNIYFAFAAFILLFLNKRYGIIAMDSNIYSSPAFFILNSILGIYLNIYVGKLLDTKFKFNLLQYIGKNSLYIMVFHFLAFKVVNFIQVLLYRYPVYRVATFPVIRNNGLWWIPYAIAGTLLPIGIKYLFDTIIKKTKINSINSILAFNKSDR